MSENTFRAYTARPPQVTMRNPEDILVEDRMRKDFGDLQALADSISDVGILNPLIVEETDDGQVKLLAGERRLRASKLCGAAFVPTCTYSDLDGVTRAKIELEENLGRKDFTWAEEVEAKLRIFELKQDEHGKAKAGQGKSGWSMRDMAELMDASLGSVSSDLALARAVRIDTSLGELKNKSEAVRVFKQTLSRAALEAAKVVTGINDLTPDNLSHIQVTEDGEEPTKSAEEASIYDPKTELNRYQLAKYFARMYNVGDAFDGLAELDGIVQIMYMDPPYAIDYHTKRRGVDDKIDEYVEIEENEFDDLMTRLAKLSFTACSQHAVGFLWHTPIYTGKLVDIFSAAGWHVQPNPLIWVKPDRGVCRQPARWFASQWEPCLMMRKGAPAILPDYQGRTNVFTFKSPGQSRVHPTEKPIELTKAILERVSYGDHSLVCSPFLGSGNDILACRELGSRCFGWDLSDKYKQAALDRLISTKQKEKLEEELTAEIDELLKVGTDEDS